MISRSETKGKLEEISNCGWKICQEIPADLGELQKWWRYFYNTVDLKKKMAAKEIVQVIRHSVWALSKPGYVKEMENKFAALYQVAKFPRKDEVAKHVYMFRDATQVVDLWQFLRVIARLGEDQARDYMKTRDWNDIDVDKLAQAFAIQYPLYASGGELGVFDSNSLLQAMQAVSETLQAMQDVIAGHAPRRSSEENEALALVLGIVSAHVGFEGI